jgi:hypothetical protein
VAQFRYLRTTLTNMKLIHEEIKSRVRSGDACLHSVQNLLYSHLPSKNLKITVHETITLPVVLHAFETWTLTLREEYRLTVFEKMMLRRVLEPKRDEVIGG